MSWHVTQSIGGPIARDTLKALFEEAADLGLLVEASDEHAQTVLETVGALDGDIDGLVSTDGNVAFVAPLSRYSSFPSMEAICREASIPFITIVGADEEANGQTSWWRPGMTETVSCETDHDAQPVVTIAEVKAAHKAGTIAELIEASAVPELEPTTILD